MKKRLCSDSRIPSETPNTTRGSTKKKKKKRKVIWKDTRKRHDRIIREERGAAELSGQEDDGERAEDVPSVPFLPPSDTSLHEWLRFIPPGTRYPRTECLTDCRRHRIVFSFPPFSTFLGFLRSLSRLHSIPLVESPRESLKNFSEGKIINAS